MPNTIFNKVVTEDGRTLIDLSQDTVTSASHIVAPYVGHLADGTQVTGIATSGNVFLITLTQNQNDEFIPDCTFAEYLSAYQANKIISAQMADATTNGSIVDIIEMSAIGFTCSIHTFWINNEGESDQETIVVEWNFVMNSQGYSTTSVMGYYDITNATAAASDVARGKYFYGSQGIDIGTSSGNTSNLQSKTNISPTTSSQTITADSGYDGLSSVQINAMPAGTAGTPTATKGTVSNHSVSVTPSVTNTTGYITGGTKTGTAVTVSASELVSGNKEITANGTGIDVANYSTVSVAVPSSSSSKNIQVAQSTSRATTSTYTSLVSLTCSTTGTYDIYWDCFRSTTSGTSGSQLYIGGSAYGTANTAFTNHAQNNHLTGVSLTANQTVAVYARSRGNNYYAYVGSLVIVQTA